MMPKLYDVFRFKPISMMYYLLTVLYWTVFVSDRFVANANVYVFENLTDIKGNNVIREIRLMYMNNKSLPVQLVRGVPLFAEIDFVPYYFPSNMDSIVASVLIPETIRRSRMGGPWIIGWNQEKIDLPPCRLCTNREQSYTIPVTIFLPDDTWCPEGPIQTGWKIEASLQSISPFPNSDMTIAMVVDQRGQMVVKNNPNPVHCKGISEIIRPNNPTNLTKKSQSIIKENGTELNFNSTATKHN